MHPDYIKYRDFELSMVDDDIASVARNHYVAGLPIQMQIVKCLKELISRKGDLNALYENKICKDP